MKFPKKIKFKKTLTFLRKHFILISILSFFAIAYLLLSLIKHNNFMSGYDLSIIDQTIWKYSQFKNPITTTHEFFDTAIYVDHLELIFIFIAPLYWIFDTVKVLIVLQVASIIVSGIAVFKLSQLLRIKKILAYSLLVSYLSFFGFQFAIWSDVHSLVFAIPFLAWFIYFLTRKSIKLSLFTLIFAMLCKEDIALLTLLISGAYYLVTRWKFSLLFSGISLLYLFAVFALYFPAVLPDGYRFANSTGLLGDPNPLYLFNTLEKQRTIFYSLGWFGFLPLFSPIYFLPFVGDISHYFVIGNGITRTEGIFLHYRSTVALLLIWPTMIFLSKFRRLNSTPTAIYVLVCALFFQYYLHLPLSYLSKNWFWTKPIEVENINSVLKDIPNNASVATQINISPHLTHRDEVYTLFLHTRNFKENSPCNEKSCTWFRVGGNPEFLIIDKGESWNILHYLADRKDFFDAVSNLERNGNIKIIKENKTTKLYKIHKKI